MWYRMAAPESIAEGREPPLPPFLHGPLPVASSVDGGSTRAPACRSTTAKAALASMPDMAPTPPFVRALAAGLLLLAVAAAQNPAPPAAPAPIAVDPTLPERLKELKTLVSHPKMADDFQAVGLIQSLVTDVAKIAPKDKEKLAKALGEVFRTGRLRPADKDVLYREAGDALGKLGLDGSKELAKAIADARFKDHLPLLSHWIVALGRTEDDKQVDFLLDTTTRSPRRSGRRGWPSRCPPSRPV